jgi:hypothetical protein
MTTALGTAQLCSGATMNGRAFLCAAAAAVLAGCGGGGERSAVAESQFIAELGEFGQAGLVGLSAERGGKTRIAVQVIDPPSSRLKAEIRRGGCGGPIFTGIEYPLEDVREGESETVLDVPLDHLRRFGYIVLVRKESDDPSMSGVCANLTEAEEQ